MIAVLETVVGQHQVGVGVILPAWVMAIVVQTMKQNVRQQPRVVHPAAHPPPLLLRAFQVAVAAQVQIVILVDQIRP